MRPAPARSLPAAALCELLLRQSPGCTWLLAPDQGFHAVFGDPSRIFGRTAAELDKLKFADLFAPEERGPWPGRIQRVFAGETLCAAGRFAGLSALFSIALFPVRYPEDTIAFAGGLAQEVAERDAALRALRDLDAGRTRLTRLVHDQVGPYLSAAGIQLDLLRMDLAGSAAPLSDRTGEIQATLETIMGLLREFSHELSPMPERIGLRAALDRLAGRLRSDFKGNVRVLADATAEPPAEAATALYRIAQEAAGNAARHAGCSAIEILLKSMRSGPALEIRDNGQGFDAAGCPLQRRGLGILMLQHYADQAGIELQIESAPGKGTVVRALCRLAQSGDPQAPA